MSLVLPHGKQKKLMPLLLSGEALAEEKKKAQSLKRITITSRETSDAIMMGIGAFTPLTEFMGHDDWKRCCDEMLTADGTFWPIPITLSADAATAGGLALGDEVALVDEETGDVIATMKVEEKYKIDKAFECEKVFRTAETAHPGVAKVMEQAEFNIAGPVKVLSESYYPEMFPGVYMRPEESRAAFERMGWSTVAALQLRNPMHRSHEYLAKIAVEICDGVFIHQLVGKLKAGDIPAEVRVKAVNKLAELYFAKDTVIQGGYPLEMRYAGPREALLHAVFRQNYGCSHLIVGRDHAGVGSYYGPFDAQKIFDELPDGALLTKPLKIDWTFWCFKCHGMASMRTCPHSGPDRLMLSGTKLRELLAGGGDVPPEFSRPEVLEILREYYATETA